ncbi:hypothetical protein BH20ACI2_BH20ACI2_24210 [soil metagenome]
MMRVVVVWRDLAEAVRLIQTHGFSHPWRKGIEPYRPITDLAGGDNDLFDQRNGDAEAAKLVADKQAFHLANVVVQFS